MTSKEKKEKLAEELGTLGVRTDAARSGSDGGVSHHQNKLCSAPVA